MMQMVRNKRLWIQMLDQFHVWFLIVVLTWWLEESEKSFAQPENGTIQIHLLQLYSLESKSTLTGFMDQKRMEKWRKNPSTMQRWERERIWCWERERVRKHAHGTESVRLQLAHKNEFVAERLHARKKTFSIKRNKQHACMHLTEIHTNTRMPWKYASRKCRKHGPMWVEKL